MQKKTKEELTHIIKTCDIKDKIGSWKEYITRLFDDYRKIQEELHDQTVPVIIMGELE